MPLFGITISFDTIIIIVYDLSIMPSLTRKILRGRPYYYLRECQRVNGKPKIIWTRYIGSAQTLVDRLTHPEPEKVSLCEFGGSAATFDIATSLDVVNIIDRHVPKRDSGGPSVGQYLLLAALNRCLRPMSKAQIEEWHKKTALRRLLPFSSDQLSSQRFWDHMDRVSEQQIIEIERDLSASAVSAFSLDLRCLLFDATNFFTFVDSFNERPKLPQRGRSKEGHDNLRILGLALLVTSDGDVPLFHHTYAGNQHDTTTFQSVSRELADRCRRLANGVSDITLVFDKGNNSDKNLKLFEKDAPFHFVGSLVPTHHPKLLAIPMNKMKRLDTKQLPAVWSYRTQQVVFGVERTVLCTFNQPLFDAQKKTLQREIRKRMNKLRQLQLKLKNHSRGKVPTIPGVQKQVTAILNGRHVKDLFRANVTANRKGIPHLKFSFREKAWKSLASTLLGKTILFTDQTDWSDEQIVLGYRSQFHVEASFRRMKNPHYLTFRPTFHWTDQKLIVHAFYCVLALMILTLLCRKLKQAGIPLSIPRMMNKLTAINEVTLLYPTPPGENKPFTRTVLSDLDDEQRAIVKALEIDRYLSK